MKRQFAKAFLGLFVFLTFSYIIILKKRDAGFNKPVAELFNAEMKRPSLLGEDGFKLSKKVKPLPECRVPLVAVTTTIKPNAECITGVAEHIQVVVVGDTDSQPWDPPTHIINNTVFLSVEKQNRLYKEFSSLLPAESFSRKSMGYAYAIRELGACAVYDFDDSNCLSDETVKLLKTIEKNNGLLPTPDVILSSPSVFSYLSFTSPTVAVNPYMLYGSEEYIWPRGYPLEEAKEQNYPQMRETMTREEKQGVEVLQVMQNEEPDVDAVWRMEHGTSSLPMHWKPHDTFKWWTAAIKQGNYAPFNAQSTFLSRTACAIAYLPHTVHKRVSDIWRSYIMQYLLHRNTQGGLLGFTGYFASHSNSITYDISTEKQLVAQAQMIINYLAGRPLSSKSVALSEEYVRVVDDLYTRGFLEAGDVKAAMEWAQLLPSFVTLNGNGNSTAKVSPKVNVVAVVSVEDVLLVPTAVSLFKQRYITVVPVTTEIREKKAKVNGELVSYLQDFCSNTISEFLSAEKDNKAFEDAHAIAFVPFGCRGSNVHIEISPVNVSSYKGWTMSGNTVALISSNHSLFNNYVTSTMASNYVLGPVMQGIKPVDRLLYVDPYKAVSETMAYLMIHSKDKDHLDKEYLPSAELYLPLRHMLGHTFTLDSNPDERDFGEKTKTKFKNIFGDSFNVSATYIKKPGKMSDYFYMNYAHMFVGRNADEFEAWHGVYPKYVAISDTDSVLMTPVAPEDMFDERGRPVVIGRLLSSRVDAKDSWKAYSLGTKAVLKKPEMMMCMTNFPMVFKVKHMKEMVKYIERIHGKRFVDVMSKIDANGTEVSQFNIMCNYAWYFHREEYDWHLQKAEGSITTQLPGGVSTKEWKNIVKDKSLTVPVTRNAHHFTHSAPQFNQMMLNHISFCSVCKEADACKGLEKYSNRSDCKNLILVKMTETFFRFEDSYSIWTWDEKVGDARTKHFDNVKKMIKRNYWNFSTSVLDKLIENNLF